MKITTSYNIQFGEGGKDDPRILQVEKYSDWFGKAAAALGWAIKIEDANKTVYIDKGSLAKAVSTSTKESELALKILESYTIMKNQPLKSEDIRAYLSQIHKRITKQLSDQVVQDCDKKHKVLERLEKLVDDLKKLANPKYASQKKVIIERLKESTKKIVSKNLSFRLTEVIQKLESGDKGVAEDLFDVTSLFSNACEDAKTEYLDSLKIIEKGLDGLRYFPQVIFSFDVDELLKLKRLNFLFTELDRPISFITTSPDMLLALSASDKKMEKEFESLLAKTDPNEILQHLKKENNLAELCVHCGENLDETAGKDSYKQIIDRSIKRMTTLTERLQKLGVDLSELIKGDFDFDRGRYKKAGGVIKKVLNL